MIMESDYDLGMALKSDVKGRTRRMLARCLHGGRILWLQCQCASRDAAPCAICGMRHTAYTYGAEHTTWAFTGDGVAHCSLYVALFGVCVALPCLVQLIPNAIFWFTGEAVSDDDYEEGEDEDEDEDEEDEDEEDDDDEVRCS